MIKKSVLFICLGLTLQTAVADAKEALPEVLIKPFPILTWVPPAVDQEQIALYKDANFTVMSIYPDETKYGMFKQLWDGNYIVIREWSEYTYDEMLSFHPDDPQKIGYLIGDEPTIPEIDTYVPVYEKLRSEDPKRLCLVNLFPSGVSASRLGGSFLRYVETYFEKLAPRYCSLDNYPFLWFDQDSPDYYHDLELVRYFSKKNHAKLIGFIQVYSSAKHRASSESDIFLQVNSSLAYGCKALWYFNFRNPGPAQAYWPHEPPIEAVPEPLERGVLDTRRSKGEWSEYYRPAYPFGDAVLDFNDRPGETYPYVKKANEQALAWGPVLLDLQHVAVRHTLGFQESDTPVGTDMFANEAFIQSVSEVEAHKSEGLVVSWFEDKQQRPYVMIVNKRHGEFMSAKGGTLNVNIMFKENVQSAYLVSGKDGSEKQATLKSTGSLKSLRVPVGGGDAILVRLEVD